MHGDEVTAWSLTDHLLASVVDVIAVGNWQRSGGKGTRPKRIPRPGVGEADKRHGSTDRSPQEVADYLAQFAPEGSDPPSP